LQGAKMKGIIGQSLMLAALAAAVFAGGIPEPGLVMYGEIRNMAGGTPVRMTSGTLNWTVLNTNGMPVPLTATLTNINDQFSYWLLVPFETEVEGYALTPNGALPLTVQTSTYSRAVVSIVSGGVTSSATILPPAGSNFTFNVTDQGKFERVDLQVSIGMIDTDGDGLPDAWEQQYFGSAASTNGYNGDFDGDGMSNGREYVAGTSPTDAHSVFEFIEPTRVENGQVAVRWASVSNRMYSVWRSQDLLTGFSFLTNGIPATPPVNTYLDVTPPPAPVFYRLSVD
jgi:hypothetical protein